MVGEGNLEERHLGWRDILDWNVGKWDMERWTKLVRGILELHMEWWSVERGNLELGDMEGWIRQEEELASRRGIPQQMEDRIKIRLE